MQRGLIIKLLYSFMKVTQKFTEFDSGPNGHPLQPPLLPTYWPCLSLDPTIHGQEWLLQLGQCCSPSSLPGWCNEEGISS